MSVDSDTIRAPSDPLIDRVIDDRYKIVRVLGEGGMGLVYEARHNVLGTRLALKLLRSEVWGDEEALARLKREAQTASAIGHENIVDVRDFGRLRDGSTYVVMELIDGEDLLKEIRQRGPLPWERARHIALQICAALGAAHEAGVVHRDLKPENVILTVGKDGREDFVKLVDFGIAAVEGGAKITQAGRVVGTPEYMSPEQCAGQKVDGRSDIYALGVLLFEMTTGELPFSTGDLLQLVRMHMQDPPPPPSRLVPELPLGFEAVVLRCLAKRPPKRFQTMAEVAEALRSIEEEPIESPDEEDLREDEPMLGSGGRPTPRELAPTAMALPPAEPLEAEEPEPTGRRWPLVAFAVAAAVVGAAVGLVLVGEEGAQPPDPVGRVAEAPTQPPPGEAPDPDPSRAEPGASEQGADEPPGEGSTAEPAQLTIATEPSGAHVYEGDAYHGDTPYRMIRPRGDERVALTLRADGYEDARVTVSALSQPELHLVLTRARPRARPDPAEPRQEELEAEPEGQPEGHRRPFLDPWTR